MGRVIEPPNDELVLCSECFWQVPKDFAPLQDFAGTRGFKGTFAEDVFETPSGEDPQYICRYCLYEDEYPAGCVTKEEQLAINKAAGYGAIGDLEGF